MTAFFLMDVSNWTRARLYDFWGGKMHKHLHQRCPLCPCQVAFTSVHSDAHCVRMEFYVSGIFSLKICVNIFEITLREHA